MNRGILIIFLLSFFLVGTDQAVALSPSVGVSVTPESVAPGDLVTIKLDSFSTDLNKAEIIWRVDGVVVLEGIGKKEYSTTSKGLGEQTKVEITVNTTNGIPVLKTVFINPQSVDLLWEAIDSYTPPFYKGKALPSRGALVKISVIPFLKGSRGTFSNPNSLVYNWEQNYKPYPSVSGYGKSFYVFRNTFLEKEETIKVKASTIDGTLTASNSVKIDFFNPEILFYEKRPAVGVLLNDVKNDGFTLNESEISILAVPYFSSTKTEIGTLDGTLDLFWKINNSNVNSERPDVLTIRKPESGSGYSIINFRVESPYLYQNKEASIRVSF